MKLAQVGDRVVCGFAGKIKGEVTAINIVDGKLTATVLEDSYTPNTEKEIGYWFLKDIKVDSPQ